MSSSSSLAINNKRRRLNNNDINTIFNHKEDEKQCIHLINVLDSLAYITQINNMLILKEISEYATGNFINCQGGTSLNPCHGIISFLHGNNFNLLLLFGEQYTNDLSLYTYECDSDSSQCTKKVHIFACKGCMELAHIPAFPTNGCVAARSTLCESTSKYRACSMRNNCDGIYCRRCWKAYIIYCRECDEYYCRACIKSNAGYCKNGHYFLCNYCSIIYIPADHSKIKYCNDCRWCFEQYRFASVWNALW